MYCPKCGTKTTGGRFCPKCGRPLAEVAAAAPVSRAVRDLSGQTIDGRYQLVQRLGTGAMGDVYKARRVMIGDHVAVKILHSHLASDPNAAERFRREAVTATQLRHRNLVALFDVGIWSALQAPYILMELVEGVSLRTILRERKALPVDFALKIGADVCAALVEAHRLGIIHRDIKPENIIAKQSDSGWEAKVLDFGIAKLHSQQDQSGLTLDGTVLGTPQYMSPEQCLGEPVDARSDIYSLGIMLYEMLSGAVPFSAAMPSAVVIQHVNAIAAPLQQVNPGIAPELASVVMRALEKKPGARQQSAAELGNELRGLAAGMPTGQVNSGIELVGDDNASLSGSKQSTLSSEFLVETRISDSVQASEPAEQRFVPQPAEPQRTPVHRPQISSPDRQVGAPSGNIEMSMETAVIDSSAASLGSGELRSPGVPRKNSESEGVRKSSAVPLLMAVAAVFVLVAGGAGVWYLASGKSDGPASESAPEVKKSADKSDGSIGAKKSADKSDGAPEGMSFVPGGQFKMGGGATVNGWSNPAHAVTVKAFYMDTHEVTNEQYKAFLDATGRAAPDGWKNGEFPKGKGRHPVVDVSWDGADAYAKWAGKRLPTEAEWEFAARGPDSLRFPWGENWQSGQANIGGLNRGTVEVGTYKGASRYGVMDLIGNVWEWTATDLSAYPGGNLPENAQCGAVGCKIIRGGAFNTGREYADASNRNYFPRSGLKSDKTGFRCVKDAN